MKRSEFGGNSADLELCRGGFTGMREIFDLEAFDVVDPCLWRALFDERSSQLHGLDGADELCFDSAVRQVANESREAEFDGASSGRFSKPDALHPTLNKTVSDDVAFR